MSEDLSFQNVDLERNSQWHLSAARKILLGPDSPINTSVSTECTQDYQDTITPYESEKNISGGCSSVKREESTINWMSGVDFPDNTEMVFDQRLSSCSTLSQRQLFSIREISPGWAYSSETTKVI